MWVLFLHGSLQHSAIYLSFFTDSTIHLLLCCSLNPLDVLLFTSVLSTLFRLLEHVATILLTWSCGAVAHQHQHQHQPKLQSWPLRLGFGSFYYHAPTDNDDVRLYVVAEGSKQSTCVFFCPVACDPGSCVTI